jgi:hypothetical protein
VWLTSPFYFLLEQTPTPKDLIQCALLLPPRYQNELLTGLPGEIKGPLELEYVARLLAFEFTEVCGPHALGALACAMQRARISGDSGTERRFVIAITWVLFHLFESAPIELQPIFQRLVDFFLWWAADRVYPPELVLPVAAQELELFEKHRSQYLAWDPSEDTGRFDEVLSW